MGDVRAGRERGESSRMGRLGNGPWRRQHPPGGYWREKDHAKCKARDILKSKPGSHNVTPVCFPASAHPSSPPAHKTPALPECVRKNHCIGCSLLLRDPSSASLGSEPKPISRDSVFIKHQRHHALKISWAYKVFQFQFILKRKILIGP